MTGRGGWPMTVFMTADGRPFYGGTYFPKPSFLKLMDAIDDVWRNRRDELDIERVRAGQGDRDLGRDPSGRRRSRRSTPSTARSSGSPARSTPSGAGSDRRPSSRRRCTSSSCCGRSCRRAPRPPSTVVTTSLDAMASGGMLRPHRWRVRPLLRRPRVAGPPLREDALRPGAARARLPPRLRGARSPTMAAGRRRDDQLRVARPAPPRRRLLLRRGRRLARRARPRARGAVPHVDARRGAGGRSPAEADTAEIDAAARLVRHHRGRQLRGTLDPQPSGRAWPARPPTRDRGGPATSVRRQSAAAAPTARRQGAHRVERAVPRHVWPRRRRCSGRADWLRGGDRQRRVPAPRAPAARRPVASELAGRRRRRPLATTRSPPTTPRSSMRSPGSPRHPGRRAGSTPPARRPT